MRSLFVVVALSLCTTLAPEVAAEEDDWAKRTKLHLRPDAVVCRTEALVRKLQRVGADVQGIRKMIESGECAFPRAGTRVALLGGGPIYEVRFRTKGGTIDLWVDQDDVIWE